MNDNNLIQSNQIAIMRGLAFLIISLDLGGRISPDAVLTETSLLRNYANTTEGYLRSKASKP